MTTATTGLRAPAPSALVLPRRAGTPGAPSKEQARGRRWRRTSAGLYVPSDADRTVVEQRIVEEASRLPDGGAVTGWAALRLHGAGYFDGGRGGAHLPVPLTIRPSLSPRRVTGVTWYREHLDPDEIVLRQGVPCTTAARATFDAARRARDLRSAVVVLDMAASARLVSLAELSSYVEDRIGWWGVRQFRSALDLACDRVLSPPETQVRLVWILDAGLPTPLCNWPVAHADGRVIGRPDLLCEPLGVVGEYDGAGHRSLEQQRDDVRRDEEFREAGLEPFRVVGSDLGATDVLVRRMHATAKRARARVGERAWLLATSPPPVCRL